MNETSIAESIRDALVDRADIELSRDYFNLIADPLDRTGLFVAS